MKVEHIYHKNFDYSEYLGPDYKRTQKFPPLISTYVSNHVSWADIIVFLRVNQPAFATKLELKLIPVFGLLCQALGCIFIDRGSSQESKNAIIHQIQERQESIEEKGLYPPIIVFPEGGTSNGTSILSFKKGAFAAMKAVRPVFLKYEYADVCPAYDVMPFFALFIFQCCTFGFKVTVNELPPFIPNEYLVKTYAKKVTPAGEQPKENWEIFAESVRDVLAKVGQVKKDETPYREKIAYEIELGYKRARKDKNE